jgi:hypothetical protein
VLTAWSYSPAACYWCSADFPRPWTGPWPWRKSRTHEDGRDGGDQRLELWERKPFVTLE